MAVLELLLVVGGICFCAGVCAKLSDWIKS